MPHQRLKIVPVTLQTKTKILLQNIHRCLPHILLAQSKPVILKILSLTTYMSASLKPL
jgi:hypothetical protein